MTCSCDGPPHPYEPPWCGIGRETGTGRALGIRQRADGRVEVREGVTAVIVVRS